MYRFLLRPRWLLFHVVCLGAIVAMINLGFWQLRRLDEKQAFNALVTERAGLPAAPLDEVLGGSTEPSSVEWRSVTATGTYLPDESVTVVNRSQGGRAGDVVATPLRLDDGRLLLVERGFVPLGADAAAPPDGEVEIVGRLRQSEVRQRGQLSDPASGELEVVQRLDLTRVAQQLPGGAEAVVPMYVELETSAPAEAGPFPEPLAVPERTEGPHLSYTVQWFVFSACVAIGWVLAVRHSAATRRAVADRPAAAVAEASNEADDEPSEGLQQGSPAPNPPMP